MNKRCNYLILFIVAFLILVNEIYQNRDDLIAEFKQGDCVVEVTPITRHPIWILKIDKVERFDLLRKISYKTSIIIYDAVFNKLEFYKLYNFVSRQFAHERFVKINCPTEKDKDLKELFKKPVKNPK